MTVGACILVFAVSFCCGCTEEPAEVVGGDLTSPVWILESYRGVDGTMTAALAGAPVTAEFAEGSVTGSSGCNSYRAAYLTDGQSLTFDMPVVTLMYCEGADVMGQEAGYLALLGTAAGYTISGDLLTITDSSGEVILVFRVLDQNLSGTKWELTGYNNGAGGFVSTAAGSTVTAAFGEDGKISGNAGCNSYSGPYVVSGKSISIGPLAMTEMYCTEPDGVMGQESAYLAAVQSAASYRIGAGELILMDAAGRRMAVFEPYLPTPQGMTWELSGYNNGQGGVVSTLTGTIITAVFGADGQVTGNAGCNNYIAPYTVNGREMAIGPVGSTRMICDSPEGVMDQESRYLTLLGDAGMFEQTPDKLIIRDADGITLLTYTVERQKPLAGEWLMVSYRDAQGNMAPLLEGTEVTAVFGTDWVVTGRAGCNSYFGPYTTDGQKCSVGPLGLSQMYCPFEEVMDQESGYLAALGDAVSYQLTGDELTLNAKNGDLCVRYVKAP